MKTIFLQIALFLMLFVGCSSTYRVNDFSSKEKFYNDFNNSFKSKEVKVTLINDSTFTADKGVVVKNNLVVCYSTVEDKRPQKFILSDLSAINFAGNNNQSAKIILKTGEEFNAENVLTTKDSINFTEVRGILNIDTFPMDNIKTVSYNDGWKSISAGARNGLVCMPLAGYYIGKTITQQMGGNSTPKDRESQEFTGFFLGIPLGLITGAIVGYIVGYDVHYQFNP